MEDAGAVIGSTTEDEMDTGGISIVKKESVDAVVSAITME